MSDKRFKRQNSLECTCESLKLNSQGLYKRWNSRCDFCSERSFIKSIKAKSIPRLSILR